MVDKLLIWLATSRSDPKAFPADARRAAGFQLRRIQQEFQPNDWKPLPVVGPGVQEIRIHTGLEYRVITLARFPKGIYVLHAFEKRTHKTPRKEIELARQRFRALVLTRQIARTRER